MRHGETQYLDLLEELYLGANNGTLKLKEDRTGVGTYSTIGGQMIFDLEKGFPLLTSKKVFMRMITHELLWFIAGDTNIKYLVDNNVNIWNEWAYEKFKKNQVKGKDNLEIQNQDEFIKKIKNLEKNDAFVIKYGDLGPIYGKQWRNFNGQGIDQLKNAIIEIKKNPGSRRIIINAWNPAQLKEMALTPCHAFFQFVVNDGKLSCHLYQRSADMFLGVPFNIASYALLTHMIAQVTGLKVGKFVHSFGDRHIYSNHLNAIKKQLKNKDALYPFCKLKLNKEIKEINDFMFKDILIENYKSHEIIKAPIAI